MKEKRKLYVLCDSYREDQHIVAVCEVDKKEVILTETIRIQEYPGVDIGYFLKIFVENMYLKDRGLQKDEVEVVAIYQNDDSNIIPLAMSELLGDSYRVCKMGATTTIKEKVLYAAIACTGDGRQTNNPVDYHLSIIANRCAGNDIKIILNRITNDFEKAMTYSIVLPDFMILNNEAKENVLTAILRSKIVKRFFINEDWNKIDSICTLTVEEESIKKILSKIIKRFRPVRINK